MAHVALRKWYMDAVGEDGRVCIVYWASVRLGPVSLAVASVLENEPGGTTRTRTSVIGCDEPRERGGVITWSHEGLGVRGTWTRACPAVERELLNEASGAIRWNCVAPGARAEIALGDGERGPAGETLAGTGYAEVMDMTIAPWKVPIRELRWGRAVSAAGSVVWIDWRGPEERCEVFVDGAPAPARVGDEAVEGDGFTVRLSRGRVLRDGAIGTTALAGVPGISAWAPARFLTARETKWVSRAAFAAPGRAWDGWAVHEVVRFPEPER